MSIDLNHFVTAQERVYSSVLRELGNGCKTSHWMWFIFPQLQGLGSSSMAQRYALRDLAEARAYLEHPTLGPRLQECCELLLGVQGRTASQIFGWPDDVKLRSSMTLFDLAAPGTVFAQVLERYFDGERDPRTVQGV